MFVKVCTTDTFAATQTKRFTVHARDIFIVHTEGRYFAYLNHCPHRGETLDWQENSFLDDEGELLRCAAHGALFEPDSGLCVSGPCRGESLQSIPLQQRSNMLYVKLD